MMNAIVHVIMYFYYFLSSLGPKMQKYLWWKNYLTKMQIVSRIQFLVIYHHYKIEFIGTNKVKRRLIKKEIKIKFWMNEYFSKFSINEMREKSLFYYMWSQKAKVYLNPHYRIVLIFFLFLYLYILKYRYLILYIYIDKHIKTKINNK